MSCSTSYNAQDATPKKNDPKCQQCPVQKPCAKRLPARLPHLQRPLSECRGSPTDSPTPISKTRPSPSLIRQDSLEGWGREEERGDRPEASNKDVPSIHRQLPQRRNPRHGRSLVKQENVRLNARGNPSTPLPESGSFSLLRSPCSHRHRGPAPGRPGGKWAGQAGGGSAGCLGEAALTCSRSESAPCTRGPGPASGSAWYCVARPFH